MNTPMIDCTAAAPGTFRPPRLALLAGLAMMLAIASSPPASAQPSGTIEVTAGGAVNEGSTLSLRVTLSVEPASDVVIKAENSNPSALSVSPSTITLTTSNWNTGRNFQFRGLQDDDSDDATVIVTLSIESGGFTATNDNKPLTFSVQDDDPGLALSDAPLTINEGESGTFKVKLKKAPSGDVTVALTAAGDLTLGDASLTFTTSNWSDDQTVAVTAGQDSDYDDDTERISLSASGGGYDNVSASASVTVTDDDTPSGNIEVSPAGPLTIAEGASGTLMVSLSAAPKSDVTVTLAKTNDDVTLSGATLSNSALTFTSTNYSTEQSVTVTAGEDSDTDNDTDTITFTATGGITASAVTKDVTITDNDIPQLEFTGSALTGNTLTVAEGASETFMAKLDKAPSATVTVTLTSSNDDITLNPTSLEFTTSNYGTNQTVTVTARRDLDTADDTAAVSLAGAGIVTGSMTVSVTDDGKIGLVLTPTSLTVDEGGEKTFTVRLNAQPTADQTVTLTSASSSGITIDTDSATAGDQNTLTFTGGSSGNWGTAQSVTVSAGQDDDDRDGSTTITLAGTDRGTVATQVSTASLSVTVSDDDKGATLEQEEQGATLQLAAIAANLLPASSSTIGQRFDAPRGVRTATLAGRQVALDRSLLQDLAAGFAGRAGAQGAGQDRFAEDRFGAERHSGDWLGGVRLEDGRPLRTGAGGSSSSSSGRSTLLSSFSYALGAEASGSAGWSVWGRVDTGEFSGASDGVEFDGSQSSTWFGFDRRTDSGILSGVAYSSSSSDSDYTLGRFGAGIETDMTVVMPYMEFAGAGGGSGHIMLGLVDGDATLNQTNRRQGSADLSMYMVVAGGSWPAAELGSSTLSWSGDFGFSTLKTSGSELTALDASVSNIQLKGGLELVHNGFGDSLTARPRVGLLLRHDAGDGVTGTGIELTAGMQMLSASERLSLDLNLRALTMHSAEDLSDWGAGLQLRFNSRSGGEGFAFAVGPTWGAIDDDLLDRKDAFRLDEADRQRRRLRGQDRGLAGNIGYGLRALGGLLTPYSEYRFTSGEYGGARQVAGLRYSNSDALEFSLFSERQIVRRGEARSKLTVELQKRY